jgi:protein SPT2
MPIGDLLAQISGGPSEPSASNLQKPLAAPKRKADDDLRHDTSKTPRRVTPPARTSQPSKDINKPSTVARSTAEPSAKRDTPYAGSAGKAVRPLSVPSRPSSAPPNSSSAPKPSAASRPAPPATKPDATRIPPKKGSFAEILARGQRAQAVMGQVGRIQHKKVGKTDKAPVKDTKDAKDVRGRKDARPAPTTSGSKSQGYAGSSRPLARPGTNGQDPAKTARNGNGAVSGSAKASSKAKEEPKKVRKAAAATTGYAGTGRARPGAPSSSKNGDPPRGGALLNAARPRPSKRSSYDDYDEDMDDFIDYDDEEGADGEPRYDYASDGSSDMEAGMDDIDFEERKAERIARQEDINEDMLEKRLKADKEARKRQALEALRAGKRR